MNSTVPLRPHRLRWINLGALIGIGLFVAVAAAAVGRFVMDDPSGNSSPASAQVAARPAAAGETIQSLEARTAEDPNNGDAWRALGVLYVKQAITSGDPSFYDLSTKALDTALRINPSDAETMVAKGVLLLSLHQFADAHAIGQQALAVAPGNTEALAVLVDASVETGRYDDAARFVQQLVNAKPNDAALSRASYVRELNGDDAGALSLMRQAAVAASGGGAEQGTITTFVGDLLLASNDVDGADAAYQNALHQAPSLINAQIGAIKVQAARGQLEAAAAAATSLAQRSPQPTVTTLQGDLLAALGRTREAEQAWEVTRANDQLLTANGVNVDLEAALFEADHGDLNKALATAQAADSARHTIFTNDAVAWALTRLGRANEALPYINQELRLGTTSAQLHVHAAVAFAALGDQARARAELAVAFAHNGWALPSERAPAQTVAKQLGVEPPPSWRSS